MPFFFNYTLQTDISEELRIKQLNIEPKEAKYSITIFFERIPKAKTVCHYCYAYVVKAIDYETDAAGNVKKVYCEYDPNTKGGNLEPGRKVKGTIHWVDQATAVTAEVRLYEQLFNAEQPDAEPDYEACLNPDSLTVLKDAKLEAALKTATPAEHFQFMRLGYFVADNKDSSADHLVFNKSVGLKDSFKLKTN